MNLLHTFCFLLMNKSISQEFVEKKTALKRMKSKRTGNNGLESVKKVEH